MLKRKEHELSTKLAKYFFAIAVFHGCGLRGIKNHFVEKINGNNYY